MKFFIALAVATSSLASYATQLPENYGTPATLIREIHSRGNLMPGPGVGRKVQTEVTFVVETCRSVSENDFKLVVSNSVIRPGVQISNLSLKYAKGLFADCFGPLLVDYVARFAGGSAHKPGVPVSPKLLPGFERIDITPRFVTEIVFDLCLGHRGVHGGVAEDNQEGLLLCAGDCHVGVDPMGKEPVAFGRVSAAALTIEGA